jgi:hypothetical protein
MKKVWILLALALLLFAGCDQIGIDVEEVPSPDTPAPAGSPEAVPDAGDSPSQQQSAGQDSEIAGLSAEDFAVTVDGVRVSLGADPAEVFAAFGDGGADEDNNFGFIGWDDAETYKYFRHDYEGFSIIVKTHAEEGTSVISQIGLTGIATSRGIAPGDSYEDMLAQYGTPDEEKTDEGMVDCIYLSEEGTILFVLDEGDRRVSYIEFSEP